MKRNGLGARALIAGAGTVALAVGLAGVASAGRVASDHPLPQTYLLKLDQAPSVRVFRQSRDEGARAAKVAAREQKAEITRAQRQVIADLPGDAEVLYRTHSLLAGVGVSASTADETLLRGIDGVRGVYPVAPKRLQNSYAVPFQSAPAAWRATGFLGQGEKIAVIDSGLDYTHADFGGPGTQAAWDEAHAASDQAPDPSLYSDEKFLGGVDLVGDHYNPDPDADNYQPDPHPDPNPLDCGGHGSHVAGIAAGYGVGADGSTYTGAYDDSTDFDAMRIGPGMAPKAGIYSIKVFGCDGSTNVLTEAIDRAVDPNGDGDPSDHADVINLSVGSDFGSVQDGDSIAANAAVAMGVSVVAAAGNAGDHTDISGSPGDASRVLSVASSVDAASKIDGAKVTIDGDQALYGITRSVMYDWGGADLGGPVVAAPAGNSTACESYPGTPFTGKVVLVEWHDASPECPSATRGANLAAAGAAGFIFASDSESFSAGINGDDGIPGVLMVASGADAIRDALEDHLPVSVDGTEVNAVTQDFPGDNDKLSAFSSRGIHATGNAKPDVTAVGNTVFSAAVGGGSEGVGNSGTSMASPMVAGLAALVRQANPDWSPLQVKADIMNTASHDLFVGGSANPASDRYGPTRVGAGRIDAAGAVANEVLAYDDENGAVSVSFGPVEADAPLTLRREVTVENRSAAAVTYAVSYDPIHEVPGAEFTVSPAQVSLSPGATAKVTVSLAIDPSKLTKAVDPTVGRMAQSGYPRETLAEAFGRVLLEPTGPGSGLRIPVYAAPRPASRMSQPDSLEIHGAASGDPAGQRASFALTGQGVGTGSGENGVGNGDPDDDIESIAAGFELQATSGESPECGGDVQWDCWRLSEERYADLAMVGYGSDAPQVEDPAQALAYFAVSVHGRWAIPSDKGVIQIDLDVDRDGTPDLYLYNSRLGEDDVFISVLLDPAKPDGERVVDVQLVNGRFGDLDTALYDSDVMVLPVSLAALAAYGVDAQSPRIDYGVEGYTYFSDQAIDSIGVNDKTGDLKDPLSANLFEPGIRVSDADGNGPLVEDQPGAKLTVNRDWDNWEEDRGLGVMMLHLHNPVGEKAQTLKLKRAASTTGLSVQSEELVAEVSPAAAGLPVPTGEVLFSVDGSPVGTASLAGGKAVLEQQVPSGATREVKAVYSGDPNFEPSSALVHRSDPVLKARVTSRRKKNRLGWYRTPVTVKFWCRAGSAGLIGRCPQPKRLVWDGRGQRVMRTIKAADGGQASVWVRHIRIDRTAPTIRIRGVRHGTVKRGQKVRCVARDRTSGLRRRCRVRVRRRAGRVIYTATAVDRAGNKRVVRKRVRLRSRRD